MHTNPAFVRLQGTTTNGKYLLPFRTGAFVAGKPVQPVLLQYAHRRGAPQLSWETIEAPRHIYLVFATLFHSARVVELPAYWPSEEEQKDAALYAHNVRRYMVRFRSSWLAAKPLPSYFGIYSADWSNLRRGGVKMRVRMMRGKNTCLRFESV